MKNIPNISNNYFATEEGHIISKYSGQPKKLSPGVSSSGKGYFQVKLDGKTRLVHRLIYEAYVGEIPKGMTISHLNGDKYDNRLDNLTCESYSDNHRRKKEHGTYDGGYNNSRAILSKEQVDLIIKFLKEDKFTHEEIGNMVGTSRSMVSKIKNGHRYKGCVDIIFEKKLWEWTFDEFSILVNLIESSCKSNLEDKIKEGWEELYKSGNYNYKERTLKTVLRRYYDKDKFFKKLKEKI